MWKQIQQDGETNMTLIFEFDGDRNQSAIGISLPIMIQISYYSLALSDAQQKYDNRRGKWVQEPDDAD